MDPEAPAPPASRSRTRRILPLVLVAAGVAVAMYLGRAAPKTQHVRFVLGSRSTSVSALEIAYFDAAGDVARQTRLVYDEGAPRVVAHEPELLDGDYRVRIDIDAQEGRRSVERRVTLRGDGTTSVDLSSATSE